MLENYVLARKLVTDKYGAKCDNYCILVLGLFALLCKYENNKDIVIDVFNKTQIIIENDTLRNISKKHDIIMLDFDEEEDELENSACISTGISSNGETFDIVDNKVFAEKTDPYIICSLFNICIEQVLNTFIHEMNHLIKSQIDSHSISCSNNKITNSTIFENAFILSIKIIVDKDKFVYFNLKKL